MQDYILRNWSVVRTGTTAAQKSLFFNLRRLRARRSTTAPTASSTRPASSRSPSELDVDVVEVEAWRCG